MTSALAEKLSNVRDFKVILETAVKELGETYGAQMSQIVLSNPLDRNITSICEYKLNPNENITDLPCRMFPLALQGGGFGMLSMAYRKEIDENNVNAIRITLAELADIIRRAQINELVQRDTFQETFLVEINNVMNYSLGIGDALFMVVNILGKVLNTSRCLFICVDDTQAGWKCYEFWQREKVKSLQEFMWPTIDSPIVAQSLLSTKPLIVFEGQSNSYLSPVQEELQLIDVRSLLSVPIKSDQNIHGCIIVQQCDFRRGWTRGEIDMVQKVADTVAGALAKLPEEKRAREPIMRLHQRDVSPTNNGDKENIQAVRRALKGVLGTQSIPSAAKTTKPTPPQIKLPDPSLSKPPSQTLSSPVSDSPSAPASSAKATQSTDSSNNTDLSASSDSSSATRSLNSLLGSIRQTGSAPPDYGAANQANVADITAKKAYDTGEVLTPDQIAALEGDAYPKTSSSSSSWGNLDQIPTPAASKQGLGSSMLGRAKIYTQTGQSSPLAASLHKGKAKTGSTPTEFVDGPPIEINEEEAQAKLNEILASSNPTSDYVFATPGLDTRMLGRIDGWIAEVEAKDKYLNGHAKYVAEYATAIAKQINLSDDEINNVRIASLLHDVGKLGVSSQLLQRPDEELSDEELVIVMGHPMEGSKLLKSFPELEAFAPMVRAHHEEFDGNGYPDGLSGEAIPLISRIINIANAYHEMIAHKRSAKNVSPEEAKQALIMGDGKTWDPVVVKAFVHCLEQNLVPVDETELTE
jgi:HD-GYP domain-containing protein (c-di-GMP phosphodiesterase class II)/GAF domain-containing protein